MSASHLSLLGLGTVVPPSRSVRDLAKSLGADTSGYDGFENACIAGDEDHPGSMGAAALRKALDQARVAPESLRLVISCGMSRDYVPSWSIATEVIRLLGAPHSCFGVDLTVGCLGTLVGLDFASAWLAANGGGHAAIVSAERWSYTVDRGNPATASMWAYSDGAAAAVVGVGASGRPLGRYRGACIVNNAEFNGLVLIKYGGTRHPTTPPDESPFARSLKPVPRDQILQAYLLGYKRALTGVVERFGERGKWLVCNQISPNVVTMIAQIAGIDDEHAIRTGPENGHMGSVDSLLGLDALLKRGPLDGNVITAASTPYGFGAGLIEPPSEGA